MKLSAVFSFIILVFFLTSCEKKESNDNSEEARQLFSESADLILDITSKINSASDSTTIDSLSRLYEKRITDINFSYPAETDLKLTEQENDSLFKLIVSMKNVKSDKLQKLSISRLDTLSPEEIITIN